MPDAGHRAGGRRRGARRARPRARGGPQGLLRPRRRVLAAAGGSAMAELEADFLLVGGGMASAHCAAELRRRRGGGLDPAGGARAGAAVRAAAALEGVPARRGREGGRVRHPPEWYEENGVELRTRTNVMSLDPAERVAKLQGGDEVRLRQGAAGHRARTSTSCGSRGRSWTGSTTCARSATRTASAGTRRRRSGSCWSAAATSPARWRPRCARSARRCAIVLHGGRGAVARASATRWGAGSRSCWSRRGSRSTRGETLAAYEGDEGRGRGRDRVGARPSRGTSWWSARA